MALNLPINSLCTHAHDGRGGGRKEKDFRLQQNQHLSLALVRVRDRFHWTEKEYFLFHSWCAWLPYAKTCFKSINETELRLCNFLIHQWKKGIWAYFWEQQTSKIPSTVTWSTALWPAPPSKSTFSLEYHPKLSLTALWRTQELDEIHFSLCSGTSVPAPPALLPCLHPGSYTHTGEITHTDQVLMPVCSEVMSRSAPAGKENGNDMEDFFFLYCPVSALKESTQHHNHTPSRQERMSWKPSKEGTTVGRDRGHA